MFMMEFKTSIEIASSTLNQLKLKEHKTPWLAELDVGVGGGGWKCLSERKYLYT